MRKIFFHILLSCALIFQGMGAACASGMSMGNMGSTAANSTPGMAMPADATSNDCKGCTTCPDQQKHRHSSDCAPGCTVTSAVLPLRMVVPQGLLASKVVRAPEPSLVDFLQPPPTPPPIA